MTLLRVDRSPVRLFLFGLAGLLLMVGAIDVMWGHWVSTPPDTNNGDITSKGRNQQRSDYAWGMFLLVGGTGLFGYSVTSLIRRSPVLVLREDGAVISVGAPGEEPVFVPWNSIESVSSAAEKDPNGGPDRDVLVIGLADPVGLPAEPWGGSWNGDRLSIDAVGWDKPIEDVVIHAGIALERSRQAHSAEDEAAEIQALEPGSGEDDASAVDRTEPGYVDADDEETPDG